jgi:signal transduction histidine kinase
VNRGSVISVAVGFAILAAIFAAAVFFIAELQRAAGVLRHNFDVTAQLLELVSTIQDAETGQRGFLLTGEEDYLQPYDDAVADVGVRLAALEQSSADDGWLAAKASELTFAVQAKLQELSDTIEAYRTVTPAAAIDIVRSNRGLEQMDAIRSLLGEMREHQVQALEAAFAYRDTTASRLQLAIGGGGLAVVLLGLFAVLSARRSMIDIAEQTKLAEQRAIALETSYEQLRQETETRETAEGQLRQLQKMEAVGQLTGGMAHDFNNMLAVVISAVALIRRKLTRGETDVDRFLDGAADAAERSANLTRRLLAFSRQQALDPHPVDANKLVAGMSELLRRTLGEAVELETVLAGGLWRTYADEGELESAIINLAANARDAMQEGGRITIETANCHLDDAYARDNPGAEAGQFVLIALSDTGPGMTPEVASRAFDPFFTTKPVGRGTGLGLSQVYGFVKQSKGHVKIYSEQGAGTTVKMYLPRYLGAEEPVARRRNVPGALQPGATTEVVLVTEDDDRVRALAVDSLVELGYTVLDARDGEEALRVLANHPEVTLLFTDIVMPRMSGTQLVDEAQKLRPGLKVLYTTGFTKNAVVHNGVLDSGVRFLQKPFTLGDLSAKVREAIDN